MTSAPILSVYWFYQARNNDRKCWSRRRSNSKREIGRIAAKRFVSDDNNSANFTFYRSPSDLSPHTLTQKYTHTTHWRARTSELYLCVFLCSLVSVYLCFLLLCLCVCVWLRTITTSVCAICLRACVSCVCVRDWCPCTSVYASVSVYALLSCVCVREFVCVRECACERECVCQRECVCVREWVWCASGFHHRLFFEHRRNNSSSITHGHASL